MPPTFTCGPAKQPDSGSDNPPMGNEPGNTSDLIYAGSPLIMTSGIVRLAAQYPVAGTLIGIAASDNNTMPGYNMGNQPAVVNFGNNMITFYPASTDTIYRSHLVNNSDVYIAPVAADRDARYGLRINTDGELVLDKNVTGTTACAVVRRIDINGGNKLVEWQLLATAIRQ
jgi:hypothetical protein